MPLASMGVMSFPVRIALRIALPQKNGLLHTSQLTSLSAALRVYRNRSNLMVRDIHVGTRTLCGNFFGNNSGNFGTGIMRE